MADKQLPAYQRSSAIQPLGESKNTGYQRVSQALNSFNQNLAQVGKGIAETKAKEAGELAGRDPNFEPSMPITGPDRIFREAAIQTNRMMVATDITQNIERLQLEALDPKSFNINSAENFSKVAEGYAEGVLQSVPEFNRGYAEDLLKKQIFDAKANIQGKVYDLNKNQLNANLRVFQRTMQDQIDSANAAGDYQLADQLTEDLREASKSGLDAGISGPEQYSSALANMEKSRKVNRALGEYSRELAKGNSAATEYLKKFNEDETTFDPLEKLTMFRKFAEVRNNFLITKGASNSFLNKLKNYALSAKKAGASDADLAEEMSKIESEDPAGFSDYSREYQAAGYLSSIVKSGKYATPMERKQILDSLNKSATDTTEQAMMKSKVKPEAEAAFAQMDSSLKRDPAAYAQDSDTYKQVVSKAELQDPMADPDTASIEIQKRLGVPKDKLSILTKAQAADLVSKITDLPLPEQGQALQQLRDQHPSYKDMVMKDLTDAGLNSGAMFYSMVASNKDTAAYAPMVQMAYEQDLKALQDAAKIGAQTVTDMDNKVKVAIQNNLGESLRYSNKDNSKILNDYMDGVKRVALYQMQKGTKPDVAVKSAADILINKQYEFYDYGGMFEKGKTSHFRAPIGTSKEVAKQAAKKLYETVEIAELYLPDSALAKGDPRLIFEQYKADILNNGHVMTSADNKSLVLLDAHNNPVIMKNGKPLRISFQDMKIDESENE